MNYDNLKFAGVPFNVLVENAYKEIDPYFGLASVATRSRDFSNKTVGKDYAHEHARIKRSKK